MNCQAWQTTAYCRHSPKTRGGIHPTVKTCHLKIMLARIDEQEEKTNAMLNNISSAGTHDAPVPALRESLGIATSAQAATVRGALFYRIPSRSAAGGASKRRNTDAASVPSGASPESPAILPMAQGSRGTIQSRPYPARTLKVMESAGHHTKTARRQTANDYEREGVVTTSRTASGFICVVGQSRKIGRVRMELTSPPRFYFSAAHKRRQTFLEMASAPGR